MAGVKGRSGRRKTRDEEKRTRVIEKAWDIIELFLNDENIPVTYKIKTAEKLATKDIPQEIDAKIHEITRMARVEVDGHTFIPLVGTEPKDEDDSNTEDASNSTEADATPDKD